MTPTEQATQSLCPICLERIEARRAIRGDQVFLEKTCPRHGRFSTRIWDGEPAFSTWQRPKIPTQPEHPGHAVEKGCPFDCGLCPDHRQRSCTILLEITDRCNLGCPVCYADSKNTGDNDPSLATIEGWFKAAARVGPGSNIQLSGGEPTMRDDLPRIVAMGREAGFKFIQLNTNGLRLADDEGFVRDLADAGLASVFLQFDGTRDAVYERLRSRPLLATKKAAIEQCGRYGIGVVLVPTLVPGVNDNDVGNLLRLATENVPVVRALHFQPVSYFGRFPHAPDDEDRLTLPQLMRLIEEQSGGDFKANDFNPPGCENSLCSFSANYLVLPGCGVRAIAGGKCCSQPIPALEGARNAINSVARQWRAPGDCCSPVSEKDLMMTVDGAMDLDAFLRQARTHRLSVSAMAFQDVWNLDLERVRDCCIHVMAPDTRLIPFCLYNLTSQSGKGLYRP
jgi:hypothetical protein